MVSGQLVDLGVGIVAADKNDNSRFISVFIQEQLPYHEGAVTNDVVDTQVNGVDHEGNAYSHILQKTMAVKADWKKTANRITAPNVRKGERVRVLAASDTEVYYWEEMGRDPELRRAESITWGYNASGVELTKGMPVTADNHYTITVDGNDGHITIKTTMANGEKVGYTVQLHGKAGHFTVSDNKPNPNTWQIDSNTNTIITQNGDGSYISMAGPVTTIHATKQIILDAPDVKITATNSVTTESPNTKIDGKLGVTHNINTPLIKGEIYKEPIV